MKLVNVKKLEQGQIIGQPLYDEQEKILVKKGTRLTSYMINRLIQLNYSYIYIYAEDNDYELQDVIRPELRQKAVNQLRKLVSNLDENTPLNGKKVVTKKTEEQLGIVRAVVADVVDEVFSQKDIVIEMLDIKHINSALFQHSVNTMIHASIIGSAAGLNRMELEKLAAAALFHDIGHTMTPDCILKKPGELTPEEMRIARDHTVKGFALLTTQFDVAPTVKIPALEHHEKYDGTGYPNGKKGDELHLYSRIIAIANRFDSLSSERPYRKPESLSECMEYIMGGGGSHFDPELTRIYMQHINPYPINTLVKLNDDRIGVVIDINPGFYLRPQVKIVKGKDKGEIINLINSRNLVIKTDLSIPQA
ncbi:MAG: HD-GYP domain-containing protein [Tindallia sp. MSAO_Bac2]|nr:MAG: HD-GYP domain-containing protein [Tindallia sp. MSAO_Bac2]